MAKLTDVMAYLIQNYPESMADELSNARLTKMIYLADWHSCINGNGQITNIDWYFDNYGPFVKDIKNEADANPSQFQVIEKANMYGSPKRVFKLKKPFEGNLPEAVKKSLDHIISVTKTKYWSEFIRLVYSTHPIASSERYSRLDLVAKALEYNSMKAA